jgi:hypothetical protein
MLGNTLTLPITGGDVVLVKVNQDSYSSEYALRTSTIVWRAKIRHSQVKSPSGVMYDRHNFEVVKTTLATESVPEFYNKFFFVDERKPGDTVVTLADGICDLSIATSNAFLASLVQWES